MNPKPVMTLDELRKELRTLVKIMRDPVTRPKGTHENIEFDRAWTRATGIEEVALLVEALDGAAEALADRMAIEHGYRLAAEHTSGQGAGT